MSAHCDVCGSDLVFGTGEDWQLMTCQLCECRELLKAAEQQRDEAQREAESQMSAKLEAQTALMAITEVLALTLAEMGNGWKEGVFHILARIEEIVDQANADAARAVAAERRAAETEAALRLAYPYMKDALEEGGMTNEIEALIRSDLEVVGPLLAALSVGGPERTTT